jgi:hypothetical protein
MKRHLFFLCFACFVLGPVVCIPQYVQPARKPLSKQYWSKLREGDMVFIRSRSDNAPLIAALSNLDPKDDADDVFTHCGIVFKDADGQLKVYEGAGRVGVRLTLAEWQWAESKHTPLHNLYVLRWSGQPELTSVLGKIKSKAKELHDTSYDNGFSWTNDHAYCSELVWKAFADGGQLTLCQLPKMAQYVDGASPDVAKRIKDKLNDPDVRRKYREGRGYQPEESAISPEDIFRSPSLVPVTDDSP